MNKTKALFLTGSALAFALIVSQSRAQTFTFSTVAGGSAGTNDGFNTNAQFIMPSGVAVDNSGNLYIADAGNNAIREITPSGTNWVVTTIAGGKRGAIDGMDTNAEFYGPTGIAIDAATNLYVADQFNYTIRKITPSGTNWVVSTIAGLAGTHGTNDGTNMAAEFYNPIGIAVDGMSNLFVADELNNSVRKITPQGTNWVVSTLAGGTQGAADGTNGSAQFYNPFGVAVGSNDLVFVSDLFNNTIRLLTPVGSNWVVTTIAGQTNSGASNGMGTNASFLEPRGLALDTNGNLYVVDSGNSAIREIMPANTNWVVSTLGGGTVGNRNGVGTNAQFNSPFGIAADGYGDIYIADYGNNSIRLGVSSAAAPDTGNVEVTLTPANAVTAGAAWQLNGGSFQSSGTTLSGVAPGSYLLTFSNISGFSTPAPQMILVTAHQTFAATGNYAAVYTVTVNVLPSGQGSVTGGGIFLPGSLQTLTATGSNDFVFVAWVGDVTGRSNPLTVTVNTNLTVTAFFAAVGSNTLTIITNGDGTVSPNPTGKEVRVDQSFLLKATPAKGNVFSNWTGSVTTNKNPLTVKVTTSMVLQANFIPNPFLPFVGTYNGLFSDPNGIVTEQTAGMIKGLHVTSTGTYSGALLIDGTSRLISGAFSLGGIASKSVTIQGQPVAVAMMLSESNLMPQVTGTVSGTNNNVPWAATLITDRATNTLPSAEYTMLIPPDTNLAPSVAPIGDGYASITNHAGTATITGALADGTPFSQVVPVSAEGYLPIFDNLYGGKGLLLGWVNLNVTNTSVESLAWIHPSRASGLYRSAFTNVVSAGQNILSPWTNSEINMDLLNTLTNFSVLNGVPGTNTTSLPLAISVGGEIGPAPISGSVKPKTGIFTVIFENGPTKTTGHGAILFNATNGGGYFQTSTTSGAVILGK